MPNSKDILQKKATDSESLQNTVKHEENENVGANIYPERIVDKEGKKILVFKDPLFTREKRSVVNYTMIKGKWEFETIDDIDEEEEDEKCAVKFKPLSESSTITIAFKSLKDRLEFMDSIFSDSEMKQQGTGMSLEKYANSKVLQTTSGLIGLSLAGYGLYKIFKKRK